MPRVALLAARVALLAARVVLLVLPVPVVTPSETPLGMARQPGERHLRRASQMIRLPPSDPSRRRLRPRRQQRLHPPWVVPSRPYLPARPRAGLPGCNRLAVDRLQRQIAKLQPLLAKLQPLWLNRRLILKRPGIDLGGALLRVGRSARPFMWQRFWSWQLGTLSPFRKSSV